MKQDSPLVSTVIATHERPALLSRTLDCLARQTWRPLEVVIVDDGSTGATEYAVGRWRARARPDFRVRYLWQENRGPATARNRGVASSSGEFIQFLDDDDLLRPDALEQLVRGSDGTDDTVVMSSYQHWRGGKTCGRVVRPHGGSRSRILAAMIRGSWFVPIHGYLFSRTAIERIGRWNPTLTSQEDDEYLLRAALAGLRFRARAPARVFYCQHDGVRRATPGKPGESVLGGLAKRMRADLAIREAVFSELSENGNPEAYRRAFSQWHKRFQHRYRPVLVCLDRPSGSLLEWLASRDPSLVSSAL